jgi:hypothetical protein
MVRELLGVNGDGEGGAVGRNGSGVIGRAFMRRSLGLLY